MVRSKIRTIYGEIQDPYNAIWFHKPNIRHKKYQMTQWTQIVPKNASTWNAFDIFASLRQHYLNTLNERKVAFHVLAFLGTICVH